MDKNWKYIKIVLHLNKTINSLMKKLLFISTLVLICLSGKAQTWFDIGLKGGIGSSFMYNSQIFDDQLIVHKFKPAYAFGAKIGFNFIQEHQITFDIMKSAFNQGFTYTPENSTISSNLWAISLLVIPRIAPFRYIFSRPVSSG